MNVFFFIIEQLFMLLMRRDFHFTAKTIFFMLMYRFRMLWSIFWAIRLVDNVDCFNRIEDKLAISVYARHFEITQNRWQNMNKTCWMQLSSPSSSIMSLFNQTSSEYAIPFYHRFSIKIFEWYILYVYILYIVVCLYVPINYRINWININNE